MSVSNEMIKVRWLEQNGMYYKAIKLNNFMISTIFFLLFFGFGVKVIMTL